MTYPSPNATDGSAGGEIEVLCSETNGNIFAIGNTTVTCNATDESGNDAFCSFSVIISGKK